MIDKFKQIFNPDKKNPEIEQIEGSLNKLKNPEPETPNLTGFFAKILPQSESPKQINDALQSIRSALNLPSQKVQSAWNSFTGFFRKNRKPALAQRSSKVNQLTTTEIAKPQEKGRDDDDQTPPPGGDASATNNPEISQERSNISTPESEGSENSFRQLEQMLDEMEDNIAQQKIKQNQTILQNTNPYYQNVENSNEEEAFEYLESLVEDEQVVEESELNKRISLLSDQIEQLLRLQLRQEDKSGVEDLKTMLLKELKEGGFSKHEVLDFFEPIIDRIWQKISEYQITTPQFDSTTKTLSAVETDPELVNLRQELKELVEIAKSSGLSVQSYERITGLGLTPELLKVQIENLKLEIITKTLKDIQQNKPIAINLETQKLITDSELVRTAIERSPEFLVTEFFQNFIVVSQERIKNPQAPEFEKQAIIALLNTIYTTFAFKSIFVDQPLFTQPTFTSREEILNAVKNPDKQVIYTDGKNSFVVSMLKIKDRISLKMKPMHNNGFGYFQFYLNQIGKDYPLQNFTVA